MLRPGTYSGFVVHPAATGVIIIVTTVGVGIAGLISLAFVAGLIFGACVVFVLATGIFTAATGRASILLQI